MSSFPDSIYFAADKTSVGKLVSAHACAMPETSPPPSSTALPCLLFIGKPVLACPLLLAGLTVRLSRGLTQSPMYPEIQAPPWPSYLQVIGATPSYTLQTHSQVHFSALSAKLWSAHVCLAFKRQLMQ